MVTLDAWSGYEQTPLPTKNEYPWTWSWNIGGVIPPVESYLWYYQPEIYGEQFLIISSRAWYTPPAGTVGNDVPINVEATGIPVCNNNKATFNQYWGYQPTIHVNALTVDLDIEGIDDEIEDTIGDYVFVNGPRKKVIIRKVEPSTWNGNVFLERSTVGIEVYGSPTGNDKIFFNGTNNKFSNSDLLENGKELWVKGTGEGDSIAFLLLRRESQKSPDWDDKVKFIIPAVDFLDASKNNPISTLKVGKWQNAFNAGSPATVKANFIDLDPDKFYVRVNDQSKKGTSKVSVMLSTDSDGTAYDDNATEIELNEEPANSGIFISASMLMVSDDVDDAYTGDDTKNDRTHKIALGGKVKVKYPEPGTVFCEKEAGVPPSQKTVSVNIIILRTAIGGAPVIPVDTVSNFWKIVKERYAQVGVDIQWTEPTVLDPPAGVDLGDGFTATSSLMGTVLDNEAKSLITAYGTTNTTDDIHVFYVNQVKYWTPILGWQSARGMAVADFAFDESEDPYTYNIFISNLTESPAMGYTAAHELLHLLTNTGNLMNNETWRLLSITNGTGVTDTRRITAAEEEVIRGNSHVY
jgi:hypothetical protein